MEPLLEVYGCSRPRDGAAEGAEEATLHDLESVEATDRAKRVLRKIHGVSWLA